MKAFIVRPFGVQSDINFDVVQQKLIEPALLALDIQGGTTEPFLQAGNIKTDMFQQLLVADLVIADISIHNANVFYELGIRHSLQSKHTFLLRAKSKKPPEERKREDSVPFDVVSERYLEYDSDAPESKLPIFIDALKQTIADEDGDSPIFRMLPDLEEQDRSRFLPVPRTFRDDVELAAKAGRQGLLGLLAMEAKEFFWASEGLRVIGRAQFNLKAHRQAKATWEELQKLNPADWEANQRLGTIYQRLGDLDASDLALQKVIASKEAPPKERAEAISLYARNIKDRWRNSWKDLVDAKAPAAALQSPDLLKAYHKYRAGFQENLDSFYPGLNALSLLTIQLALAAKLPDVFEARFESEAQAAVELESLQLQQKNLSGAVSVSLEAEKERLRRSGEENRWVDISAADYQFLTSGRPTKVAFAYSSALQDAPDFYIDAARSQIEIFDRLGVLQDNAKAALEVFKPTTAAQPVKLARVVLFTGHMIDEPGRTPERFPNSLREAASAAVKAALKQEVERTEGAVIGMASGANGGDLLFHGACRELGLENRLLLPLPADTFRNTAVSPGGRYWEDEFDRVVKQFVPVPHLTDQAELPLWLSMRKDYTTWQRANLWLIHEALALGAENFTLLALWDGVETQGEGGTSHMRTVASKCGATLSTVYLRDLPKADSATGAV